jgi:hypothetical protein
MAQTTTCRRGREGEITFPAFAASERGEAPGPGAERDAQVGIAGAGSPTGAASKKKGRARFDVKELNLSDFEALVVETAKRLLANEHGNTATLRPSDVARELWTHRNDTALWTAIEDILRQYRYRELDGWRLTRAEKKRVGTYLRYTRATLRCPLCGKLVRRHSAPFHAFAHLERLERRGVLQLSRENGSWVVVLDGAKYTGAGWTTLLKVAEKLGEEGVVVSG